MSLLLRIQRQMSEIVQLMWYSILCVIHASRA